MQIDIAELDKVPRRINFTESIELKAPLLFLINDYIERKDYQTNQSVFYIFGILENGTKTCVIIENINIFVDVKTAAASKVVSYLQRNNISIKGIKMIKLFPFHGFSKEPVDYTRLSFNTFTDRLAAIKLIQSAQIETANDDTGAYFAKFMREMDIRPAGWNVIEKFREGRGKTNCDITLLVNACDIKKAKGPPKDKLLVCSWDIENYKSTYDGLMADSNKDDWVIFMISSLYFWHYSDKPLLAVCCTMYNAKVKPVRDAQYTINVVCHTEADVLKAHFEIMAKMKPDILASFNGGSYDWRLIREKLRRFEMICWMKNKISMVAGSKNDDEKSALGWTWRTQRIKIDATTEHIMECHLMVAGMIDIDVMPIFMKLYSRAEVKRVASLNYFLQKNNLEAKDDMPYMKMFKIYEDYDGANEKSIEDMGDVAYYCDIDCLRPQQLLIKRAIITEKREKANLARVSLHDTFYYADGMKVRNLIGRYCFKRGYAFSNKRIERAKDAYPGAWVFPPEKGLNTKVPITGLDFASLYPSLMMCYNLSPDKIVMDDIRNLELEGYTLYEINVQDVVKAWSVRWGPDKQVPFMGIFGSVVKKLFDRRVPVKAELVKLNVKKEQELALNAKFDTREIDFQIASFESKSNALKVLANTFYGESGNCNSPIYSLAVAAGITAAGQNEIKRVAKFLEEKQDCHVHYGDTDSVYVSINEIGRMKKGDEMTRREFWTILVQETMKKIKIIRDNVNAMLRENNGTNFLRMAYEEVGFPTVFCGKKKYFMTPHTEMVNFSPKNIFIRGIDIKKQGQPPIAKELGELFMERALSPENDMDLDEIAIDLIKKFSIMARGDIDIKKFVLVGRYKPAVNNVSIQRFVQRMREIQAQYKAGDELYELYNPPESGDKFEYVMVKKPNLFDHKGKKLDIKKGDQMEYLHVFQKMGGQSMELDTDYYMQSFILGLFARFISYKFADDEECAEGKKYLEGFINTKKSTRGLGIIYKHIYKLIEECLFKYTLGCELSPGAIIEFSKKLASENPSKLIHKKIMKAQIYEFKRVFLYREQYIKTQIVKSWRDIHAAANDIKQFNNHVLMIINKIRMENSNKDEDDIKKIANEMLRDNNFNVANMIFRLVSFIQMQNYNKMLLKNINIELKDEIKFVNYG
ncbi:MAG: DNA polymerase domain-containing protein [Acidimicrobiales bacterium]